MNLHNISLNQIIITIILILVFVIFCLIVLENIKKVRKSVKETNESSRNTSQKISELDKHVKRLSEDNQEFIKVHRQIKDKSETMNKMLKQTNKIYKEVLDRKTDFNTTDEFVEIDYEKINSPSKGNQQAGEHLTQMLRSINSDKESISNKINVKPKEAETNNKQFSSLTTIDMENIKLMNEEEVSKLFLTLKDYKSILNKEIDYYLEQIEQINSHKTLLSPSQRLNKKENIYNEIKEVEKKLDYQQALIEETKKRKEEIEIEKRSYEKEQELDILINDIVKRK